MYSVFLKKTERSDIHHSTFVICHSSIVIPLSFTQAGPLTASGQSDRERNWWTSNIERPTSNIEWMYSVCFKKDFAKRYHLSSFDIRYYTVFRSRLQRDLLFNPWNRCGQFNHQETVPFWCSFIHGIVSSPIGGIRRPSGDWLDVLNLVLCRRLNKIWHLP